MLAVPHKFKTKPLAHQLRIWNLTKDHEYHALFHEPGTGKTKIVLDTAAYLFSQGKIWAMLYIAPAGVLGEILNVQVTAHMDSKLYRAYRVKLSSVERMWEKVLATDGRLVIIGMNVESFSTRRGVAFAERFLKEKQKEGVLMVVDESTTISNASALRAKAIVSLGGLARYRRILTGTPIAESVLDLPNQIRFLGPLKELLGTLNYYTFRARYCELLSMSYGARHFVKVVGTRRLDELMDRLKPYTSFVKSSEVLDLPPKVYQRYHVEMDGFTKRAYRDMANRFMVEVNEGRCTADRAVVKLVRLMQIVSGFIVDEESNEVAHISPIRYNALIELLRTLPGKIAIWATFTPSINLICSHLAKEYGKDSFCRYDGEVSVKAREENLNRFKTDPVCRFFVSKSRVGGYGIDLTVGHICVFFNCGWSIKDRIQTEERFHRKGQQSSVLYIDMFMKGVDEKILEALDKKQDLIDEVMSKKVVL